MSELVTLRSATLDDVGMITDLVRAAYAKWVPVIGREPRPMTADYQQALRVHQIDLLQSNGETIGLIETRQQPDHLWIENIAVHPVWQGRGLGQHLLAHAQTLARQSGCPQIRLLTNAAFADNIALYEKVGFGIDHTEPFSMGGTTVYMSKTLA